jgi:exodeoxyribonuclease V gamma subunit
VLTIIRGTSYEALAASLRTRLATPLGEGLAGVFAQEWISTPSSGVKQWLTLQVSASNQHGGAGVAANWEHHFPGQVFDSLAAAYFAPQLEASGRATDPWALDQLAFEILRWVHENSEHPSARFALGAAGASRGTATISLERARYFAELFDRYHRWRPDLVCKWSEGTVPAAMADRADLLSQMALWKALRADLNFESPAERFQPMLDAIRSGQLELPSSTRFTLFGVAQFPGGEQYLHFLKALADRVDVAVYLLTPSEAFCPELTGSAHDTHEAEDESSLLRLWGSASRETMELLTAHADGVTFATANGDADPSTPSTLLRLVQAGVLENRADNGTMVEGDGSLEIHVTPGMTRQVEVLRDAITHVLNDPDRGITEDDVLVVVPQLTEYVPIIEAVFGEARSWKLSPSRAMDFAEPPLAYSITDRKVAPRDPYLEAVEALRLLLTSRFEAADVLDFIGRPVVLRKLGLVEDDLELIESWIGETEIRWGLDDRHRELSFSVRGTEGRNSWRAGLDRLHLGTAIDGIVVREAVGETVAAEVEGDQLRVLGALATLLDLLETAVLEREHPRPIAQWVEWFERLIDECIRVTGPSAARRLRFLQDLDGSLQRAGNLQVEISYQDFSSVVSRLLSVDRGVVQLLRKGITFTSEASASWLPYRVVCILGFDDDAFAPQTGVPDDLLVATSRPGDPNRIQESKLNALSAVLQARDLLIVTRSDRDVRSNRPVDPPVVLDEFLDAVVARVDLERQGSEPSEEMLTRANVVVRHGRHRFDESNLIPQGLRSRLTPNSGAPWTFDRRSIDIATARRTPTVQVRERLPLDVPLEIALADLVAFFKAPQRIFLQRSLGLNLPEVEMEFPGELPGNPGPLKRNGAIKRLLGTMADRGPVAFTEAERREIDHTVSILERAGVLPPATLWDTKGGARQYVRELQQFSREHLEGAVYGVREIAVDLVIDGKTIVLKDRIPVVTVGGTTGSFAFSPSRAKRRHQVQSMLEHLALVAQFGPTDPHAEDRFPWQCSVVLENPEAKDDKPKAQIWSWTCEDPNVDHSVTARRQLEVLVALYLEGLRQPLPLFTDCLDVIAKGLWTKTDKWSKSGAPGTQAEVQFCFGVISLDEVAALQFAIEEGGRTVTRSAQELAILVQEMLLLGKEDSQDLVKLMSGATTR